MADSKAEGFLLFPVKFVAIAISSFGLLAQDAAAPQPSLVEQILQNPLTPLVGLFFLFYFIFIRPEQRRKADDAKRMSTLKKNDRIITIGGIHGIVVSAPPDSSVVTIRIDESGSTRVKVNRSAIATIVAEKEEQDGKNKETTADTKDK